MQAIGLRVIRLLQTMENDKITYSPTDNSPEACLWRFDQRRRQQSLEKKVDDSTSDDVISQQLAEIAISTGFGWLPLTKEGKKLFAQQQKE